MKPVLRPPQTLDAIYGPGLTLAPLYPPHGRTWLPQDGVSLDLGTGGMLPIAGAMPIVCAASVTTPAGLQLLRDAGFRVPPNLHRYPHHAQYPELLATLAARGTTFAVQHVHPPCDLAPAHCWVPPEALSFLNNKGNLAHLVDAPQLPRRRVVASGRLQFELSSSSFPVVLKAITDESTGGGSDVFICQNPTDLSQAGTFFAACTHVVVEDFMPIARNLCLNYAVYAGGEIAFIGCAEQITDARGQYLGNWIDQESTAPAAAVEYGMRVARSGFARGYWGCVGIDMAELADGRVLVYDLNFRLNGSTTGLLLAAEIRRTLRQPVIRVRSLRGKSSYGALLDGTYAAMARKLLLPLCSYDPEVGREPEAVPRLRALLLGGSREEICANQRELAEMGLTV